MTSELHRLVGDSLGELQLLLWLGWIYPFPRGEVSKIHSRLEAVLSHSWELLDCEMGDEAIEIDDGDLL